MICQALQQVYQIHEQPGLHQTMTKLGFLNPVYFADNIVHNAGSDATFQLSSAVKIAYDEHQQRQPQALQTTDDATNVQDTLDSSDAESNGIARSPSSW